MSEKRSSRAVQLFEERFGSLPPGAGMRALQELLRSFAQLPYENLSKIVAWHRGHGDPQSSLRDPLTVMTEHVALGTGGTCFSLTELLRCLALAAGFEAEPVMAHMRHGPNIHCALRVGVAGHSFLVDPGYLLQEPLALDGYSRRSGDVGAGRPFLCPAGSRAGVPAGVPPGALDLFTVEHDGPRWRYRFSDRTATPDEFLQHWKHSFSMPAMRSLLATRRSDQTLLYLHNHKLRRQEGGGVVTRNVRATLPGSLQEIFGIAPEVTQRAVDLLQAEREAWRARAHGDLARKQP